MDDIRFDLFDGLLEDREGLVDLIVFDVEGAQASHDGAVAASFLHDQLVLEADALDACCDLAAGFRYAHEVLGSVGVDELDSQHESDSADVTDDVDLLLELLELGFQVVSLACDLGQELGFPDLLHDDGTRDHGQLVAAECSRVRSGRPCVQLLVVYDD